MATKLPNLVIPVTVQTDGVDRGLTAVERKLRNSTAKMKRIAGESGGAPGGAAGFGLKASQSTALLGGVGKLGPLSGALGGLGAAGTALAAPLALFGMAAQSVQALAAATKGANEALVLFKQSGEQTFTSNSEYLRKLAALESQAQIAAAGPGIGEAFTVASQRPGEKGVMSQLYDFARGAAAFGGAVLGGKSNDSALLEAQLVNASEAQGKVIAEQLRVQEQKRMDVTFGDLLNPFESIIQKLDKLAIVMGKS